MSARRVDAFSFVLLGGGAAALELHLPALAGLGAIARTRVVEADAAVLDRVISRFPEVDAVHGGFEGALAAGSAVGAERSITIVALPNHLHAAAVEAALRAGHHVLCEKPLSLSSAECERLGALASEHGRTLAVGMARRFSPSFGALRAALADGLLGALHQVEIEHGGPYAWPAASKAPFERRNGGVLADMGIHYLDLLEHLLGPLTPVRYQDDCRGGVEANCELHATAGAGVKVRLKLSRTHALANRWLVAGERGELELGVDEWEGCVLRSREGSRLEATLRLPKPFRHGAFEPTFESCFLEQLEQLADDVLAGRAPQVGAHDAARTVGAIEWAYGARERADAARTRSLEAASDPRPRIEPAPTVVTGATGFIGQHLVERLSELGFGDVRAPVRSYPSCAGLARFAATIDRVDLLDRAEVARVIEGARHVFHLAYGRDGADAARVTVEGTRNVVEAAIAAGVECVVVLSTMYVFGHPDGGREVDESFPYAPTGGEYGESKMRMERQCLELAKSSGRTRIVVLEPSCVYGPGGAAYTALPATLARSGSFGWVDEGRGIANYVYVDNLVDAMLLAAVRRAAHGERFLISDGACTWRELLSPLLGELAAGVRSFGTRELIEQRGLPRAGVKDVVRHLANDLELIGLVNRMTVAGRLKRSLFRGAPKVRGALMDLRASGSQQPRASAGPAYPPRWLADLYGPTQARFSSQKARAQLGWVSHVGLQEGQRRACEWLREARLI